MALIFDLDGVILDSMPMHTEAWEAYMEGLGVKVPELASRMHGARNDQIVAEFLGRHLTAEDIFEHGAAKERLFRKMMAGRMEEYVVGGVREFLAAVEGVPKAIGSNAEPSNVDFVLDGTGLRPYFPVTVDGHQVERAKPYPDVYLRAAERLGVKPENCVIFEDSPGGVEAGKRAGARVVGIGTHRENLEGVDLMIRDFRDARLGEWLEKQRPV
jgi:beta-phosphoglucomutase